MNTPDRASVELRASENVIAGDCSATAAISFLLGLLSIDTARAMMLCQRRYESHPRTKGSTTCPAWEAGILPLRAISPAIIAEHDSIIAHVENPVVEFLD